MFWTQFINQVRFADLLDIIVIAFLLYYGLMWLKQRASRTVAIGIALIGCLYLLAHRLGMYLTAWVFQAGLTALIVAMVLIFQEDIRRIFEHLTSWRGFRFKQKISSSASIDALLEAIRSMAHDRIGALVVIRGKETLERHIRGGNTLNGRISIPLVLSIFHPESPGHDGAMIIEGDRIDRFGVYLPLSSNLSEVGEGGTRHTAALGIAERTDAFVIVVSEERGTISIAEDGKLDHVRSLDILKERLDLFYGKLYPAAGKGSRVSWLTWNIRMKALSVAVAVLLWGFFAYRVEMVNRTYVVPIEYRNIPANWVVADPKPTETRVSLTGSERAFSFDPSNMVVSLDMSSIRDGYQELGITEKNLNAPMRLKVAQISPNVVRIKAYQMAEVSLPVKVQLAGRLADSLTLERIECQPASVALLIPRSRVGKDTEVRTEALNLNDIKPSAPVRCNIIPPDAAQFTEKTQQTVRVIISVKKEPVNSRYR
jgi:uncharacterized protein (TIGR00159 family)